MMKTLIALSALVALSAPVNAQAYCALRDPNKQIYKLFEEADSFRSIVRTVDEKSREAIGERLPFTLHFNELGRHTVYVAQKNGETLGVVHLRSEAGKWGLVEVAWAFDLNMKVVDFAFQRCRDRSKKVFEQPAVRASIIGKDFAQLRALIDRGGKHLVNNALPIDKDAAPLGLVLIRNCLKTIAATEIAWGKDLWYLRAIKMAKSSVPGTAKVAALKGLYSNDVLDALDNAIGQGGTGIVRDSVHVWNLSGASGSFKGRLAVTRWRQAPLDVTVWWYCDTDGAIAFVNCQHGWPSPDMRDSFQAQVGKKVEDLQECAGAVELVALETLVTLAGQEQP